MNANLKRCCPDKFQVHYDEHNKSISCPNEKDNEANQITRECLEPDFWEETTFNKTNQTSSIAMQVSQTMKCIKFQNFSEKFCTN